MAGTQIQTILADLQREQKAFAERDNFLPPELPVACQGTTATVAFFQTTGMILKDDAKAPVVAVSKALAMKNGAQQKIVDDEKAQSIKLLAGRQVDLTFLHHFYLYRDASVEVALKAPDGDLESFAKKHFASYSAQELADKVHSLVGQLILAIEALHEKNLVHRDIKLKNILVYFSPTGEWHLQLADLNSIAQHDDQEMNFYGSPISLPEHLKAVRKTPKFAREYKQANKKMLDYFALAKTLEHLLRFIPKNLKEDKDPDTGKEFFTDLKEFTETLKHRYYPELIYEVTLDKKYNELAQKVSAGEEGSYEDACEELEVDPTEEFSREAVDQALRKEHQQGYFYARNFILNELADKVLQGDEKSYQNACELLTLNLPKEKISRDDLASRLSSLIGKKEGIRHEALIKALRTQNENDPLTIDKVKEHPYFPQHFFAQLKEKFSRNELARVFKDGKEVKLSGSHLKKGDTSLLMSDRAKKLHDELGALQQTLAKPDIDYTTAQKHVAALQTAILRSSKKPLTANPKHTKPILKSILQTTSLFASNRKNAIRVLKAMKIDALQIAVDTAVRIYLRKINDAKLSWFERLFRIHGEKGRDRARTLLQETKKYKTPRDLFAFLLNHLKCGDGNWSEKSFKTILAQQLGKLCFLPMNEWLEHLDKVPPAPPSSPVAARRMS